jgi:hypothetical protein
VCRKLDTSIVIQIRLRQIYCSDITAIIGSERKRKMPCGGEPTHLVLNFAFGDDSRL